MQNIRLRKAPGRSNYEVVEYKGRREDGTPNRKYTSTGTSNKEEAEAVLWDYIGETEKAQVKATVVSVMDAYIEGRRDEVLYIDALEHRARNIKRILKRTLIRHVDEKRCQLFIRKRRKEGVSDGTIRTDLNTLSAALKWSEKRGYIERAPFVFRPPKAQPRDRWLTPEEWGKLMKHCQAFHTRLFAIVAVNTAARSTAILELTWDRVDMERRTIDFRVPGDSPRRKGRAKVPMTPILHEAFKVALERSQSDYVIEWAGKNVECVKRAFKRSAVAAGLPDVTAHTLRHTAASWMVQMGVPIQDVAAMLDHADCRITQQVYAKHSPDHLRHAAEALQSMQGSLIHL